MEKILTEAQKVLIDYLCSLKMPRAEGMCIIMMLWEEEATMEMLGYIAETKETDQAKLYSIASEISQKHRKKTK